MVDHSGSADAFDAGAGADRPERETGDGGEGRPDITALERDFINAAAEYGRRKHISYAA
jgi:hypothetical protein